MKRLYLIFSLLLACVCSYGRIEAAPTISAPDTLDRYLIDRQEVRQFDGSVSSFTVKSDSIKVFIRGKDTGDK